MSKRTLPSAKDRERAVEARRLADFKQSRERPPDYEWDLGDPRLSRRWSVPTDADAHQLEARHVADVLAGRTDDDISDAVGHRDWYEGDLETLWRKAVRDVDDGVLARHLGARVRLRGDAQSRLAIDGPNATPRTPLTPAQASVLEDEVVAWLGELHQTDITNLAISAEPGERKALKVVEGRLLLNEGIDLSYLPPVLLMGYPFWVRPLAAWKGGTVRQLLAHLFELYPIPPVLVDVVASDCHVWAIPAKADQYATRFVNPLAWLILRGQGGSVERVARRLGWRLSRALINHAESDLLAVREPAIGYLGGWLMYAEIHRLGAGEAEWARLERVESFLRGRVAGAATTSREQWLGSRYLTCWSDEWLAFWRDTVRWLKRYRDALTDDDSDLVLQWAEHEFTERGTFAWKGRTVASALQAQRAHHAALAVRTDVQPRRWKAHGWDWRYSTHTDEGAGEATAWAVTELTTSRELLEEGAVQRHCVGIYADHCVAGDCAIFQLTRDGRRRATIEVGLQDREILQAKGRFNAALAMDEIDIIERWSADMLLHPSSPPPTEE